MSAETENSGWLVSGSKLNTFGYYFSAERQFGIGTCWTNNE